MESGTHLILSIFFSIIPMMLYLLFIWLMDRYERESFWMVLITFICGATGGIFFGILGSRVMDIGISEFIESFAQGEEARRLNHLGGVVITAPFVEEITKGLFVFLISLHRKFDGPVDGAVYGGSVGLGFAMTENFLYFQNYPQDMNQLIGLVIIRTLFTAVMHCCAQAVLGAAIGYSKFKPVGKKILIILGGLAIAMLIHFTWNFTVSFKSIAIFGLLFMFVLAIIIIIVFALGVQHDAKIIKMELTDEANLGYIPPHHVLNITQLSKRHKKGWLTPDVDRKTYVRLATKLAMRKNQVKLIQGKLKSKYEKEIEHLREQILNLIGPKPVAN